MTTKHFQVLFTTNVLKESFSLLTKVIIRPSIFSLMMELITLTTAQLIAAMLLMETLSAMTSLSICTLSKFTLLKLC